MVPVFCSLGIGAAYLGISALYLTIDKPIFGIVWGICGLLWFGSAFLWWRTARIRRDTKSLDELIDHYRRKYEEPTQ